MLDLALLLIGVALIIVVCVLSNTILSHERQLKGLHALVKQLDTQVNAPKQRKVRTPKGSTVTSKVYSYDSSN